MHKAILVLLLAVAGTGIVAVPANAASANQSQKDQPVKHVVASGESLSTIAADNKLETWRPIWNANTNLQNPDQIEPGQELIIPKPTDQTTDRPLPAGYGEPVPYVKTSATSYAPAPAQKASAVYGTPASDILHRICMRESGCNYATNTGNGYYGAYQYDIGTWGNYGGYARADLAPPSVQDQKAAETYAARGCSPWPNTCY